MEALAILVVVGLVFIEVTWLAVRRPARRVAKVGGNLWTWIERKSEDLARGDGRDKWH